MKLISKQGIVKDVPANLVKDYIGTKEWEVWAGEPAVDSGCVQPKKSGRSAKKTRTAKRAS